MNKKSVITLSILIIFIILGVYFFNRFNGNAPSKGTTTGNSGEGTQQGQLQQPRGEESQGTQEGSSASSSDVLNSVKQSLELSQVTNGVHPMGDSQQNSAESPGDAKGKSAKTGSGEKTGSHTTNTTGASGPGATVGTTTPLAAGSNSASGSNSSSNLPPGSHEVSQCWNAKFNHKPIESHLDGEACLHHKNQLTLSSAHGSIKHSSVCVRVNGTPVPFKMIDSKASIVQIGPIAGPQADITVRYCTGTATCQEPCQIPKDEFLAAIGGEAEDDEDLSLSNKKQKNRKIASAHWNSENDAPSADENALESELSSLDNETKGVSQQLNLFKDWIQKADLEYCQGKMKVGR